MGKKGPTNLTNLDTHEVSLVDRGANRKKIALTKAEGKTMEEIIKAVLEAETDSEAKLGEVLKGLKVSEKGLAAIKSMVRLSDAFRDELPKDVLAKLADVTGLEKAETYPAPKKKTAEELEAEKQKADKEAADKAAAEKVAKETGPAMNEEVKKSLELQAERIEKAEKENGALQETIKKMRDDQELATWVSKAESDLGHYPGENAAELGAHLKKLNDFDPEVAEKEFKRMVAASKALEQSAAFNEIGSGRATNTADAWSKIEKKATEANKEGADSDEVAVGKALRSGKSDELYADYLNDNPAQRSEHTKY